MTKNNSHTPDSEGERAKRSYVKPEILWEEPFEPVTSAISCARQPGQSDVCDAAPNV